MNGEKHMETLMRKVFLIFLMLIMTAVSYGGYYAKWSVTVHNMHPFEIMIEGSQEPRPYVYRQFVPVLTRTIVNSMSEDAKAKWIEKFDDKLEFDKIYPVVKIPEKYKLEFYVLSLIIFICFFIGNIILRSLMCEILHDEVSGTLVTFLFILLFPLLELGGGYYYDLSELMFLFAAMRFAFNGNYICLFILTPFAEFNKESFLFFLIMLYPITRNHFDLKKSAAIILFAIFIAGMCYLYIKEVFAGNPGGMVVNQLHFQIDHLLHPGKYFNTEPTYGIPIDGRLYWLFLFMIFWIVKSTWHELEDIWKNHLKIALAINIPLFIFFCSPGELRNFSLSWIAFLVPTGLYIKNLIAEKIL